MIFITWIIDTIQTQLYCCVMIPDFDDDGNLPPGVYEAQWSELEQRFGWSERRHTLLNGLKRALKPLCEAGCQRVFVNGSFVTNKDNPGDIDIAWDPNGVDTNRLLELEPIFGEFSNRRAAQKSKYGCEFFPSSFTADLAGSTFLEFFQTDKETGAAKGIVVLNLSGDL